jgi:hypothetical protein
MGLGHALAKQLQASLSQINNFALFFIVAILGLGFNLPVRNCSDVLNDVIGLADMANQSLVLGLKQLQQSPDSNVLESGIARLQKSAEVSVYSSIRLVPILNED